ncbi:DUF6544 family protein [Phosphitispora sp. TUW77]|uniref:DUF6544 family protein n=1 Tax=Phosphitispora sp. TUW77 TaxID=3152361 RepID=UPI003AB1F5AF
MLVNKMDLSHGIVLSVTGILMILFNIPYSKTKTEFNEMTNVLTTKADHEACSEVFQVLVDFLFGKDKPTIKIDYSQYNFVNKPNRIAYIDSSIYGIPFEGLDSYIDGTGSMKGVS